MSTVEGFDTDFREPLYAVLFPERRTSSTSATIKGQISLFDRLLVADETPKIVDVWHRSYERLFSTIAEIGFLEEARRARRGADRALSDGRDAERGEQRARPQDHLAGSLDERHPQSTAPRRLARTRLAISLRAIQRAANS